MPNIDNLVSELSKAFKTSDEKKTSAYDTPATVRRVEDGVAWVHIPGGVDETPVKLTVNAVEGDEVQVRVGGGRAWIVGNATSPPTDDSTALYVDRRVNKVVENITEVNTHVENLEADNANIKILVAEKASINDLEASNARIGNLESDHVSTTDLQAVNGEITNLKAKDVTIEGNLTAATGRIGVVEADTAKIHDLTADEIHAGITYTNDLIAGNVTAENVVSDHSTIGNLDANYAKINATNIDSAAIRNTWVDKIMVQSGLLAYASQIYTLDAIQVNAANITAGTLDVNRLIVTVDDQKYLVNIDPTTGDPSYQKLDGNIVEPRTITADKILAGAITTNEITTNNLQGTNGWINLHDGTFFYGDGASFASATNAISWNGSKLQIKADEFLLSSGKTIQEEIEAVENWFYSVPPTTSNEPAVNWTTTKLKEQHLRDIYFDTTSGKSYRWSKDGTTYSWVEISDVQLSALAKDLHDNYPPRSEFTIAPNQINAEVSKKVGNDEIIAKINASVEEEGGSAVLINANKVNIEGAAIFTGSGRLSTTSLNNAYDAKGAAEKLDTGLGIKWNTDKFTGVWNAGEAYFCHYDSSTGAYTDANGWVMFNGVKRTVPKGMQINQNTIIPFNRRVYKVLRLSSATATTGTMYYVYYDSGWKSTYPGTPTADNIADWTWDVTTDIVLCSYVQTANEQPLIDYEQYTPVRTAQQVTNGDNAYIKAANAQTTANNAAPKSSAVAKTQRIYYRSNSSTKPTAYPTAWVTEEGNKWNGNATTATGWSRKVTPISNGTGSSVTKYLYLWTATQKQMVDGTVVTLTADDIALDDTTTVIDGGNIITGTVTANALNASDINASKKLTVGAMTDAAAKTILNSELSDDISAAQTAANTALKQSSWYATCPTAAGTAAKVATITPTTTVFTLTAGATVNVTFTNTNSAAVGDITLNVNSTGAKHIKFINNAGIANIPSVGYIVGGRTYQFVYDGTYWVIQNLNYNTNDVNRTKYQINLKAAADITNGHIICGTSSGYRDIAEHMAFDLSYPLLYAATAIAKGATSGTRNNNFLAINDITFSNNGTITSGAADKIIYLKGTVFQNVFEIAESPFLTTVEPTSSDGFYYIPLGLMSSATVGYFSSSNVLHAYIGGKFQPVSNLTTSYITDISTGGIKISSATDSTDYLQITGDNIRFYRDGKDMLSMTDSAIRIGQEVTNKYNTLISTDGFKIRKYQTTLASFTGTRIEMFSGAGTSVFAIDTSGNTPVLRMGQVAEGKYNTYIDADSFDIRKNTDVLASFGEDVILGQSNIRHVEISPTAFRLLNNDTVNFSIQNIADNENTITYTADGTSNYSPDIDYLLDIISISVNGSVLSSDTYKKHIWIAPKTWHVVFDTPPSGTVIITYTSYSNEMAMTVGTRNTSEGVGGYSCAIGKNICAAGEYSFAVGDGTTTAIYEPFGATGMWAISMGLQCISSGDCSITLGSGCRATGYESCAIGSGCKATYDGAIAIGDGLISDSNHQTSVGRYNLANSNCAFVIGNGSDNQNRSNALAVAWDGNITFSGARMYFPHNTYFYCKDSSGTYRDAIELNYTNDVLAIGYGNYNAGQGATAIYGQSVNIYTKNKFRINGNWPITYASANNTVSVSANNGTGMNVTAPAKNGYGCIGVASIQTSQGAHVSICGYWFTSGYNTNNTAAVLRVGLHNSSGSALSTKITVTFIYALANMF